MHYQEWIWRRLESSEHFRGSQLGCDLNIDGYDTIIGHKIRYTLVVTVLDHMRPVGYMQVKRFGKGMMSKTTDLV